MEVIDILNDKLKGTSISRVSVGDTWELNIGGYWLSAQSLISLDESLLNEWLLTNYPPFRKAIDQEYISKCAVVAAFMHKEVISLFLDDACNLTINFEDNGKLILPTNTDIVDWQWSLSEDGSIPYVDYIVACFWEGKVEISEDEITLYEKGLNNCRGLFHIMLASTTLAALGPSAAGRPAHPVHPSGSR